MKIVLYGNSDFAELMHYYFTTDSTYEVVAFCVDKVYIAQSTLLGLPVIAFEEIEEHYPPQIYPMFVSIGYKSMRLRKTLFEKTVEKGYEHVNYISSKAQIDTSNRIGVNNVLLASVVPEPFAQVGDNNIVNTATLLCHHVKLSNHCFIGANSLVGGFTQIKENCFIGFSSTVLQKLIIEEETFIGAGTLMNKNSDANTFYRGVPAQKISTHQDRGIEIRD